MVYMYMYFLHLFICQIFTVGKLSLALLTLLIASIVLVKKKEKQPST